MAPDTATPHGRRDTVLLIVTGILFFALLGALRTFTAGNAPPELRAGWIRLVAVVVAIMLGIYLVRAIADQATRASSTYLGAARLPAARFVFSFILYTLLAVVVGSVTAFDLGGLAVSGAVTGVIIGIAAQTSLSNVIAGVVILFARPYRAGEYVTVRAAAFAGSEYSGEIGDISLFYTTIFTGAQEIRVPNSAMVNSVVVVRPQILDVYVPLILPPARWEHFSTTDLTRQLAAALPEGRRIVAVVERMDGASVQIGLHASVASEVERTALETALLRALAPSDTDSATGPHPDGE